MSFIEHEIHQDVENLLIGREIVATIITDYKILIKFDNQEWLEIMTKKPVTYSLSTVYTEWVED